MTKPGLEDLKINVKIKLAALWSAAMFCYIYGDYFGLYIPGKLEKIGAGTIGPFETSQGVLVGTSVFMAIPAVMVFLSLVLKPIINRWINMVLGLIYTAVVLITLPGSWTFYITLGIIEMSLTLLIFWYALRWPRSQ